MSEVIGIGASPRRKENLRFLTGRGNYVADIRRPGMAAGVFLRSPHAHVRIKSIDATSHHAATAPLPIPRIIGVPDRVRIWICHADLQARVGGRFLSVPEAQCPKS